MSNNVTTFNLDHAKVILGPFGAFSLNYDLLEKGSL